MLDYIFQLYYSNKIELLLKIIQSNISESIFLSLLAAWIFHYVFITLPLNKKRNKLRPIIETDINSIYFNLTITFDLIFRHQERSPSYYQYTMKGGQLIKKDFHIALQNKVTNNNFLLDKNSFPYMMTIGDKLENHLNKINALLQHTISLYDYCSVDEILLLNKLRQQIEKIQLDKTPLFINYENNKVLPIPYSLESQTNNFYQLYLLYIELITTIIYTHQLPEKSNFQNKIVCFYFSKNYKMCKRTIQDYKRNYPNMDSIFLDLYLAKCELKLNNNQKFKKLISNVLKEKPELIGHRYICKEILNLDIVKDLLKKYYSDEEIKKLKETLDQEEVKKDNFENQNKNLYKYFHHNKEYSFKE